MLCLLQALFLISTKPPPTLTQPEMWSPQFNHLLECCLVRDQSKRLSAAELLQHPFLRDVADNAPLLRLIQEALKAGPTADADTDADDKSEVRHTAMRMISTNAHRRSASLHCCAVVG